MSTVDAIVIPIHINKRRLRTLTHREIEVFRATVYYGTDRAAAAVLGISPETVKNVLTNIRRKLNITNTIEVAEVLWYYNLL